MVQCRPAGGDMNTCQAIVYHIRDISARSGICRGQHYTGDLSAILMQQQHGQYPMSGCITSKS